MIYRSPLTELQRALYKTLSSHVVGYQVYDSATPIEELVEQYKGLEAIGLAIINDLSIRPTPYKSDALLWDADLRIDLFSNYRGKLKINEMIDDMMTILTSCPLELDSFTVMNVDISNANVGAGLRQGPITWQQGYVEVSFKISQQINVRGE